ncbi:SDR family oxidoreductase [Candidatus Atribacteria bacterium MT.SAG.1]|nr:SDR family oxidoreductase [Candidatus Atribacteria bacterium MT.SAG.1]
MYKDLKNKVAIITGARRGMGRTHALKLAQEGVKVVVSDISEEDCQKVVDEIEKAGGEGLALKCDVSQKKEVDELVKKTVDKFGKVDILINNAGIAQFKPFLELTEEEWDRTLDINLKGYFLCAQAVSKEMAKQKSPARNASHNNAGGGVIVNIASVAMGQVGVGFPNIAHYCASKGGIVAMTEALALELAPLGIRINVVSPGMIETPMIDPIKQDPKMMEGLMSRVPLRRFGKPEEVSDLVLFLASDASSYMTGSTVVIDGGWLSG